MAKKTKKTGKEVSAAGRGIWSGAISFGLVNVQVRAVSAKQSDQIHFTMLDPSNLSPIGYKYYNKATGKEVPYSKIVDAYEHKPHSYVIMTDADFKKANPKATQTIDIQSFVNLEEIDPVFFDQTYYLLPNKGGEKGYHLLCEALKKAKRVGIAKVVFHTKQHLAALIPSGDFILLELLHFAEEVKDLHDVDKWKAELEPATGPIKVSAKEIEMAQKLIAGMTERWDPHAYKDTYRQDVLKLVESKVKAGKATEITEPDTHADTSAPGKGKGEDLMSLLRKSLSKQPAKRHSPHSPKNMH